MIDKIKEYVRVKRAALKVWVLDNKFKIFWVGLSYMAAMILGAVLGHM